MATKSKETLGPSFGNSELSADYEPFNQKNGCSSWIDNSCMSYNIRTDKKQINLLTGLKVNDTDEEGAIGCRFKINELEVWAV
jgi:hypothetical protein